MSPKDRQKAQVKKSKSLLMTGIQQDVFRRLDLSSTKSAHSNQNGAIERKKERHRDTRSEK